MCSQRPCVHTCPCDHPPTPGGDLPLLFRDVWAHVPLAARWDVWSVMLFLSPSPRKGQEGSHLHTTSADWGRIATVSRCCISCLVVARGFLGSPCTCGTVSGQKPTSLTDTTKMDWDDYENWCCHSRDSVPAGTEPKTSSQELHQRNHNG